MGYEPPVVGRPKIMPVLLIMSPGGSGPEPDARLHVYGGNPLEALRRPMYGMRAKACGREVVVMVNWG